MYPVSACQAQHHGNGACGGVHARGVGRGGTTRAHENGGAPRTQSALAICTHRRAPLEALLDAVTTSLIPLGQRRGRAGARASTLGRDGAPPRLGRAEEPTPPLLKIVGALIVYQ